MIFSDSKATSDPAESKFFVYLTCIYIVVWYLQLGSRINLLNVVRFEFVLGAFLSLVALFKLLGGAVSSTPLRGYIISWLLVLGFYTLVSYDRAQSWDIYFNRVLKFSMMALFMAAFVKTEWALKCVLLAFLFAMLKMGQEGVHGWLGGGLMWMNQGIMRLHGATMLYRHPNSFSGMAVGCLPFIYYLFPVTKLAGKAVLLFLLASSLIIILFTGSRTGYVATILLALLFWREQIAQAWLKYTLIGCAVLFIGFSLIPEQYIGRLVSIYTLEEASGGSANARIEILSDAMEVFITHPFGVGVSAFPAVRGEMFGRYQDTHNLYLELLTNVSVVGFIVFFMLLYNIVKLNKFIITNSENRFLVAVSKAVIAFIYARLFLGAFGMDTYEIYWWFSIGLTGAVYRCYVLDRKVESFDCKGVGA